MVSSLFLAINHFIQTVHILQLDSALLSQICCPGGAARVRPIQPYFPLTQPDIINLVPLQFLIIEGGYFFCPYPIEGAEEDF